MRSRRLDGVGRAGRGARIPLNFDQAYLDDSYHAYDIEFPSMLLAPAWEMPLCDGHRTGRATRYSARLHRIYLQQTRIDTLREIRWKRAHQTH